MNNKRGVLSRHTLRWSLSLSYIIGILVSVPTLLGVGVALILLTPPLSPAQQLVWILEKETAPQVARELQQDATQRGALVKGVKRFTADPKQFSWNVVEALGVMIVDREGRPIASDGPAVAELFAQAPSRNIVQAAYANDQQLADLTFTFADGRTIAAVPLLDAQEHSIGVFFVIVRGLAKSDQIPTNPFVSFLVNLFGGDQQHVAAGDRLLPSFLFLILLLILTISIIGVVCGMVTAHRIIRRLQRITSAVHAWSQGQFQETIHDRSLDEVGQLVHDLNHMASQLQNLLNTQQHLALMGERQRMARDLHDSVKQQTFAITLLIGAARKVLHKDVVSVETYLAEAETLAGQTRQELTAIIDELRPLVLSDKTLGAALEEYVRCWSRQTTIPAKIAVHTSLTIPSEVEEAFLRIAQEALSNVARHSHAHRVEMEILKEEQHWCLVVCDDGNGFDVGKSEGKGLGLSTIRERAQSYQGVVHIHSTTTGTRIEARIPLASNDPQKRKRKHHAC